VIDTGITFDFPLGVFLGFLLGWMLSEWVAKRKKKVKEMKEQEEDVLGELK
jgi:hypothetical protein